MTTPADNLVPITGNALIDGLIWGAAWQFGGGAHMLTYSLSLNDSPNNPAWTTALSNAARLALADWSNVANLTFVESGSGSVYRQSSADLALILTGNELQTNMAGLVGLGLPPSPSFADSFLAGIYESRATYPHPEGDVALDNYYTGFNYLNPGGIGLTIMLHEIGHALGLKHTNDASSGRPTFAGLGISNLDSNLYTVMSYTDAAGHPLGTDVLGNAATPMPLDILAMQQIYGANTSYHTGDDTYTFYGPSAAMAWTIWDAGGNDTLAAGAINQYNNVTLDLREGHYSQSPTISGLSLAIAYGAVIENAIGGDGNDTLIGNAADNHLNGGTGFDTAQYSGNQADYTIAKSVGYGYTVTDTNLWDGNDGTDTLFAIEHLQFAVGAVDLPSRILEHVASPAVWMVIDNQHDYNSDGTNDLWWKQANGSTAIWVMDGTNTQAPHIIGPNTGWTVVDATTDYNRDGKADLAWHHTDGSSMLWINAVDLATAQGAALPLPPPVASPPPPNVPPLPPDVPPAAPVVPPPPPPDPGWPLS
ncbi:MAG: M10 family metallopeptidase C-terminal domain-containing protein [Rhodocyclales bacterium]|nr:M10 family metallopeptidase C-terminal domain-containing protein [Rhodocyclales bacterium]